MILTPRVEYRQGTKGKEKEKEKGVEKCKVSSLQNDSYVLPFAQSFHPALPC